MLEAPCRIFAASRASRTLSWTVASTESLRNYGLKNVRFPRLWPVGSKVRATGTLKEVTEVACGLQYVLSVTVEREGGDKPVCIGEPVYQVYRG